MFFICKKMKNIENIKEILLFTLESDKWFYCKRNAIISIRESFRKHIWSHFIRCNMKIYMAVSSICIIYIILHLVVKLIQIIRQFNKPLNYKRLWFMQLLYLPLSLINRSFSWYTSVVYCRRFSINIFMKLFQCNS